MISRASTFTFHYELIITELRSTVTTAAIAFTFHYELIITIQEHISPQQP